MKILILITSICLLLNIVSLTFAQLPRQIGPRIRGFPGKRNHDFKDITGRNVLEAMYRLNNSFIPYHYELEMRVIIDKDEEVGKQFTAPGKLRIQGKNQERTNLIVLHANDLSINESSVYVKSQVAPNEKVEVTGFSMDGTRDFFSIELGREVKLGEELEIYMEFEAKIIEEEKGLFHRTYKSETGEKKRIVATQLQAVDARRLFPCFDEPDLKATFQLTVIRKSNYSSLSNTQLLSSTPDPQFPGWVMDKYAKTVRMSAYLLAFSVHDYGYIETHFGKKPARTYGPKHLIEAGYGNYSVEVVSKCLSFYESYFNESYKLAKMDSIAIPEYSGAMENWGLNVYGNNYILFSPEKDTEARRNLVTLIIAHELAHQWFGNLVTSRWWNEIFLNEGLSTYVQYLGMEASAPEFNAFEFAILDAVQFSMLYDAGQSTHPLTLNVSTPDEIDGMFSTISYEKGASIFRMMEAVLTKDTLKRGLQLYLKRFSFKGAEQDDLYDCLQEAALEEDRLPLGFSIHDIMHSWTEQSGFPLVKVQVLNETHVNISQQRFANQNDVIVEPEGAWYVPITIVKESEPFLRDNIPQVWLENDGASKLIEHNSNEWIMLNQNATGFYRVLYDDNLHQLIQKQLEKDETMISPLSRSQLIDDYFVFAEEKYVGMQAALDLTTYLHKETHFTVWSTFFDHFSAIYEKFSSHPAYPLMKAYLQPKIDKALLSIGLEERPSHKGSLAMLRADLLDWSCSLESPLCKEYAGMLFAQWKANPSDNPIKSVDARNTLQCAMVAVGGKPAFDFLFKKYRETMNDTRLRRDLLSALACGTDDLLINELLYKTLSKTDGLMPSDATATLNNVVLNPFGRLPMLNFLSENFDSIVDIVGKGSARPIGDVLTTLASFLTTEPQYNQFRGFVDDHESKLQPVIGSVKSAISVIKENMLWMDTTGADIWMWLWHHTQPHPFPK